jgi:mono/diheme cytochrome c family protein
VKTYRLAIGLAVALGAGAVISLAATDRLAGVFRPKADPRALLHRYCVDCHNAAEYTGGVAFDTLRLDNLPRDAETWEHAVRKLRTGFMPPADAPRPKRAVLDGLAAELETRLDRAAAEAPNPGIEGVSRLNRAEYVNVIRDLLAYDASAVAGTLPADDAIKGFDNIAQALTVSPTLIQGYVNAALKISRAAVGDRSMVPTQVRYEAPAGLAQNAHIEGLPLGTRGGMRFTHNFPLDATYEFRVAARGVGFLSAQRFCKPPKIEIMLNGEPVSVEDPKSFRLEIPAGPQTLAVALIDAVRCAGADELYGVYSPAGGIQNVEIQGPFDATGPGDTPSRRAIFKCYPQNAEEQTPCARRILTALASKAFRRPLSADDSAVETLMGFYRRGRRGGDFEAGIEHALSRLLVDPQFVYRFEQEPADLAPGEMYRISDLELASRLSFLIWSSIPDDELLKVAAEGKLSDPDVLARQVLRMLADARSEALVENFAGQWLQLRELRDALPQDSDFDANLRDAFRRETELLFGSLIREDRSVLDLLDSDYTYLNERLARHYGIPGVRGSYMRRVELDRDSPRRGLLGEGSILTVTSVANRTSPVVRGEWIMENLLGAPVPAPPPGVDTDLSKGAANLEAKTLRERMERHRANSVCASCHALMDPFGFALENFDLVGRWRDTEAGAPLDTRAVLVDGTPIDGPAALRRALLDRREAFVTALTEKLLTYALGRIPEYYDMPAVRKIVRNSKSAHYRFSSIVLGIAKSVPFQEKLKSADNDIEPTGGTRK